jgi:hypothetical protein
MAEYPILMNGESVRAILEGRKTQTRRLVRPQPVGCFRGWVDRDKGPRAWFNSEPTSQESYCPYGQPGDRLWVRETWGYRGGSWNNHTPKVQNFLIAYRADKSQITFSRSAETFKSLAKQRPRKIDEDDWDWKDYLSRYWKSWRSSTHMPRWASRITLEITDVRVQRLQDISEEDAKAEGVKQRSISTWWNYFEDCYLSSAQQSFSSLRQSINGKNKPGEDWDAWDANPWVWAVTFKVVRP